MALFDALSRYIPCCEQERQDKDVMLYFLRQNPDALLRENKTAHFTASAWLLNHAHDKALMVWHNLYRSWSWTGGHADGEADLLCVALREAQEETGLVEIAPASRDIFSLEVLTVDGHEKRGVYVPSHLHLNVTYLLCADEAQPLRQKPDENSGVQWFWLDDAVAASTEPWMRARVYEKLNRRLRCIEF